MDSSPRSRRWYAVLGMMTTLAVIVVVLGAFGLKLRAELNIAEDRLSRVEVKQVAEDAAERTARVATCFGTARTRPNLVRALAAIAAVIDTDVGGRLALLRVIENYEANAPTLKECRDLARENDLDPDDFPPPEAGR